MIKSVVLDIGETIRDDTWEFHTWADWLGVPRHTFSALLGALHSDPGSGRGVFATLRPDIDLEQEFARREAAGLGERFAEADLYPDVRPALHALQAMGVWVGIAGNQSDRMALLIRELGLPVDAVATSGEWGLRKPDRRFFEHVIAMAPGEPSQIAYVGDHRDNDILPAAAMGLRAVLIRRGPWGHLWFDDPQVVASAWQRIQSLLDLPRLIHASAGLDTC